jgi:hypothetical protein
MEKSKKNIRKYVRYRDPETEIIQMQYTWSDGEKQIFPCLIANESLSSIGCVYIGHEACNINDRVIWFEYKGQETECTVIRCKEIEQNVYYLVVELQLKF